MNKNTKNKLIIAGLTASAVFFANLIKYEGFSSRPYLDSGCIATIGIGSTQYENGERVKMTDKPITKERAIEIVKNHVKKDEQAFNKSLAGVKLSQAEYDVYLDFVYNYGQATFNKSSIRKELLKGNYKQACLNLLKYHYIGKKDCIPRNSGCYGVWKRQIDRYNACIGANQ